MSFIKLKDSEFITSLVAKSRCHYLNGEKTDLERDILVTPIYAGYSQMTGYFISVNGTPPKAEFYIPLLSNDNIEEDFRVINVVTKGKAKTIKKSKSGLFSIIKNFAKKHRLSEQFPKYKQIQSIDKDKHND